MKCYCGKILGCLVESNYHQNRISMLEHCIADLNRVTSHHASQIRVYEHREESFRYNLTTFSEKWLGICILRLGVTIILSLLYLSSVSPRISCLQCISATLSVDDGIVTTLSNLCTHSWQRQYLLSNLSWIFLSNSQCVQQNQLHYCIHKVLCFHYGIYCWFFLMLGK